MPAHWLAIYLPNLRLEVLLRGGQCPGPVAVTCMTARGAIVSRCNSPAAACGIRVGMSLSAALARCDRLGVHAADAQREQRALEALAHWAYQFSPRISFDPALLLLEISGSQRLFGGELALRDRIQGALPRLGYHARLASAPTPAGAALLARLRPGSRAMDSAALRRQISDIPLRQMTRDPGARALIEGVGLETIGDCLALPRPELGRRTGPELLRRLDQLLGTQPDPRSDWRPPAAFREHLELLGEIEQQTALLFPARRLILSLCGFLRGRDMLTQQLKWRLVHRDHGDTDFALKLQHPTRDPDHLLELLRERVERLVLPAPVIEVELEAAELQPYRQPVANDLFGDTKAADVQTLIERLRARLGGNAVSGLESVADHRPEQAWRYCEPGTYEASIVVKPGGRRPTWLLPQTRPLTLVGKMPSYGGALQIESGPERIESGWWDGKDIARDYFVALSPAGERLWIYRDLRGGGWYLHGLFG